LIRKEQATRKNSQLAAAHTGALKIGRRLSRGCEIGYVPPHFMLPGKEAE